MGTDSDQETDTDDAAETFSKDDVNAMMAGLRKKADKRIAALEAELEGRPTTDDVSSLREKIAALSDEKNLAGKSEIEKLQHQHGREIEKLTQKLKQQEDEVRGRDEAVQRANTTLRTERLKSTFSRALANANVVTGAAGDALGVLLSELTDVETSDDGVVRATYGKDLIDEEPEKIAEAFLASHKHFASADTAGGAGTRPPNASGRRGTNRTPLADQNPNDLFDQAGPMPASVRGGQS